MGMFKRKKVGSSEEPAPAAAEPSDAPEVTSPPEPTATSPFSALPTKTPPPVYSTTDLTNDHDKETAPDNSTYDPSSGSYDTNASAHTVSGMGDTLDPAVMVTSHIYSPGDYKGAVRQPRQSGEPIVVARYPTSTSSPPPPVVNDGSLPEVVVPGMDSDRPQVRSLDSASRLSVRSPESMVPLDDTVTPLHLLADQSDMVDCPFCRRRVETRVEKDPSTATHASAFGMFIISIGGVVLPYKKHWKHHVSHFCTNCSRKVAIQRNGETMRALGTPEHLREVSRFPRAASQQELKQTVS